MPIGHTLTLDLNEWDLTLDSGGNIATSVGPYAIAQNVANAVRLFTNDAWYDPERGIRRALCAPASGRRRAAWKAWPRRGWKTSGWKTVF